MNKRGTLVQATLIGIIIILLGAAMIFFFLKAVPFNEQTDIEACHNSVILRNNALLKGEGPTPEIPLNCKTQKVKISTTNSEIIQKEIANQMYTCWWMLGEGKMEFWSESSWKEFGLGNVKSACVICSTIEFSDALKRKNLQLDMASYIENTKVPSRNITYLQYFTEDDDVKFPTDVDATKISTDKDYVVLFMGIEGDELWEPIARDLSVAAGSIIGSSFLIGPKWTGTLAKWTGRGITAPVQLAGKSIGISIKAGVAGLLIGAAFVATQTIWTAHNQAIVAQHCDGSKKGCMQVMLLPMDAVELSGVCNNIESIP